MVMCVSDLSVNSSEVLNYANVRYKCVENDEKAYKANLMLSCSPFIMISFVISFALTL